MPILIPKRLMHAQTFDDPGYPSALFDDSKCDLDILLGLCIFLLKYSKSSRVLVVSGGVI